jgi:acyl dehydratase
MDLIAGETITTAGRTIGEGDITLFAGLAGDFTPIHVDDAFARTTPFGERIAHGPLTLSVAVGLLTQTGLLGERVIGLVNVNWDFAGPVRIGDTIRAKVTVEEVRPTSKTGRNLATFLFEVVNQRGETVQTGRLRVIVKAD